MARLSQRALDLQESAIRKLDNAASARDGVRFIRLNIGQPDVPTPRPLLDAIRTFQPEVLAYGPASGTRTCREAGARYHSRWSPGLGPEHVAVTTGGSEALLFAFTVVCDPGDEILAPEPYYTNYNGFSAVAGARVRALRTRLEEGFALPSDDALDAALTHRTRAIVFSNPTNPTGSVHPRSDLERVVAWAMKRGLFVIADEVYRRVWFTAPPPSALELDDAGEQVIVIDSMSKTFSACGLRLGFLVSRNAEVMERVERIGQARLGPQPLAQVVAIDALALPESYYDEIREAYRARIEALHDAVAAIPGVSTHRPEGAFYLMLKLPVDDTERFARFLVHEFQHEGESLMVAPGPGFYADPSEGRDEIRLAAVVGVPQLIRAADLLRRGLEAYRSGGPAGQAP